MDVNKTSNILVNFIVPLSILHLKQANKTLNQTSKMISYNITEFNTSLHLSDQIRFHLGNVFNMRTEHLRHKMKNLFHVRPTPKQRSLNIEETSVDEPVITEQPLIKPKRSKLLEPVFGVDENKNLNRGFKSEFVNKVFQNKPRAVDIQPITSKNLSRNSIETELAISEESKNDTLSYYREENDNETFVRGAI